ncbi:hypothetical protein ACWC09_25870 [Streptomyces sp. NPDC001617]
MEAVLDELYTTPPSDFVARRETLVAAAKTAGRVDDARRIHAARRPTLAAWAANVLLRSKPEESRQFLELGGALREAYRALDAGGLKDLSAQRRRVVSALSRQAVQLARDAGHRLSEPVQQDLEATLRAVLADPDAADQWAGGRLINALTPPSEFTAQPSDRPGTRSRPEPPPPARASKDELAKRRRARQEQLARAQEAAEAAEQRLREERARQADADAELQRARERTKQARRRVSAIEEQMQQAREECQRAENEQQEVEEHSRSAADALARAERVAHETAQHLRHMTAGTT